MKNALFGNGVKATFTFLAFALVVFGAVAAAYATGVFGVTAEASVGATPTTSSSSPNPTATSDSIVRPRAVTTGTDVPVAQALDDTAYASVTSGWVLTVFDSGTFDALHQAVPGTRIVYLVSPAGDRYEVGSFDAAEQVDLAAWNVADGKALLVLGGVRYTVFDLATTKLSPPWTLCGDHPVTARITPRDDGTWGFRGYCIGAQIDGVYDDIGTDVTPADYYRAPFQRWDADIEQGGVAIYWSESPHPTIIVSFPGSDEPSELVAPPGMDSCVPIGVGRRPSGWPFSSIAVACTTGEQVSAWEETDAGVEPIQLVTASTVAAFASSTLGGGVPFIDRSCVVGNREVLEIQSLGRAAAFVDNGVLSQPMLTATTAAEHCWGASGDTGLFSGHGSLWTTAFGVSPTPLIEVSGSLQPGEPIGVALTRSIIAP